jgi:hypothetical protein
MGRERGNYTEKGTQKGKGREGNKNWIRRECSGS